MPLNAKPGTYTLLTEFDNGPLTGVVTAEQKLKIGKNAKGSTER